MGMDWKWLLYPALLSPVVWVYLGRFSGSNAIARLRIKPPPQPEGARRARGASTGAGAGAGAGGGGGGGEGSADVDEGAAIPTPPRRLRTRGLSFMAVTGSVVNPFINATPLLTPYERIKYSITAVYLMPIRLTLAISSLLAALTWLSVCTIGVSKKDLATKPLPRWRRVARAPARLFARAYMFCLGFYWISTKGKRADPSECSVIVPKHVGFIDPLYLGGVHLLSAVSRAANGKMPLVGRGIHALQCILVDRLDPNSRAKTIASIKERSTPGSPWGQFMIFPEGTTTSSRAVISFKHGAFLAGQPVQPVAVRYPYKHFDPCWVVEGPGMGALFLRMACQFVNKMEVEWLPVYHPSAEEKRDPQLYARNVQHTLAKAMGVPSTDHGFSDVVLAMKAVKYGLKPDAVANMELSKLRKFLDVNVKTAQEHLDAFAKHDTTKSGKMDLESFAKVFGHGVTPEITRLFDLLDEDESGYLDFKEYLTGLAIINEQGKTGKEAALRLAFGVFDTENKNRLTRKQLLAMLRRALPDLTLESFDHLWREADSNGDGTVSMDEFIAFAMRHADALPLFKKQYF